MLFEGFPRVALRLPGATFPPSLREGTGLNNGASGSILFGNDSWNSKNKSNGKGKGKNNRGSFSYHPQAEESAWGPVRSG